MKAQDTLKGIFNLDHSVKLYVPSTVNADSNASSEQIASAINLVMQKFSQWFGGATANDAIGAWYSEELKKVITEKVTIITSFADADSVELHIGEVVALAMQIKSDFGQEAVSLEYDNKLYLV